MDTAWWARRGEPVRVLTTEQLWGLTVALIAVPSTGHLERVPASELRPLVERTWTPDEVAWRAVSGLVWRAMTDGEPLAVARGGVVPLPHQLAVLDRAMSTQPLRLLLADEVGLGKTIEAGLIVSELKARELIRRVLVVAPKGVQLQWIAEMADRFGEEFVLVGPGGVPVDAGIDPWRVFDQVVCSLDAVKPLRTRTGWTPERIAAHNERRARAIVEAGWDLVVIDEAHHVAGSSDASGRPLFRPRTTTLVTVPYGERHVERSLYEAVTDYVRHGYRRARVERRPAAGFLVLLMQRLVSSSTAAILAALERRLLAVTTEDQQLRLFSDRISEWDDLTGEEQQAVLADVHGPVWGGERAEIARLVDLARKSNAAGIDAKARYLLDLLSQAARDEGNPTTKAVVFTEFVPTQEMLVDVLGGIGISAVAVN